MTHCDLERVIHRAVAELAGPGYSPEHYAREAKRLLDCVDRYTDERVEYAVTAAQVYAVIEAAKKKEAA